MSIVDQEVKNIEHRIRSGTLRPGDRLPPIRDFAQERKIAPNTAAVIYKVLGRRGLVRSYGRRGTFVAEIPPVQQPIQQPVPAGIIDLSDGNPDPELLFDLDGPLSAVGRKKALYGDVEVLPDLQRWLQAWFAADGIPVDHLGVVSGALDGVERVLAANLRPGDRVAVEDPGYPWVVNLCQAMGFSVVPVAVDGEGMVSEYLATALSGGIDAIIVTPRAQNPTGVAFTEERRNELSTVLASAPGVLVIEDDHAADVAGYPHFPLVNEQTVRWAIVRSMAKSLGPDLRVAGLVGDAETIARVKGRQALGPGWVSGILQQIVVQMVTAPDANDRLTRSVQVYRERRQAFVDVMDAAGISVLGQTGMNLWIPVRDEGAIVAAMQNQGFAIRPGARHRIQASPGVRITTAAADPATLVKAAESLVQVLAHRSYGRST